MQFLLDCGLGLVVFGTDWHEIIESKIDVQ